MAVVTQDEIDTAVRFFHGNDISVLEQQAREFNTAQPSFTALIFAWEKDGIPRGITEDILESIFVVYYVYTKLKGFHINEISIGQFEKNLRSFEGFLRLYNKEKAAPGGLDVSKLHFLKDKAVSAYGARTLADAFGDAREIPKQVILSYFALLKAIEYGAEKADRGREQHG